MEANQMFLFRQFEKKIQQSWDQYCKAHSVENRTEEFIAWLIDQQLISDTSIRRYTIISDYNNLYPDGKTKKTEVVRSLSLKYNLSERSIWTIIRKIVRS
ncbi:MAG: hypothetical protein AAFZ15_19800 [Bacteroidota bacterium]